MLIPLECTEPDESMIEKAIACLRTRLGVQHIHQWILGWAAVQSSMPEALSRLAPLWQVRLSCVSLARKGISHWNEAMYLIFN